MNELDILAQYVRVSGGSDVILQSHSASTLSVFLNSVFNSGRVIQYDLVITLEHDDIKVRENENSQRQLPSCCVQRHINPDGSFCLGWTDKSKKFIEVVDQDSAERWWATLMSYLKNQYISSQKREWNHTQEWAHGEAVIHQKKALDSARLLSENTKDLVEAGRISVKSKTTKHHKTVLTVYLDKKIWYIVRSDARGENFKVVCAKQKCIFHEGKAKKSLKKCSKKLHQLHAIQMACHIHEWVIKAEAFTKALKKLNINCCGTMDDCPLKTNTLK